MSSEEIDSNKKCEFGCELFIDTLDDHPQIISDLLGLKHSKFVVRGSQWLSPISKRAIQGKFNEHNLLIYAVEKEYASPGIYLNNPIEKMLEIMDSKKDLFINILKKYPKNHLSCFAYFYDTNPYFLLNKYVIYKLSKYNIDLKFDLYCLGK